MSAAWLRPRMPGFAPKCLRTRPGSPDGVLREMEVHVVVPDRHALALVLQDFDAQAVDRRDHA